MTNEEIPVLKVRYHREMFPDLPDIVQYGNFIDVYAAETVELKAGESTKVNLGLSMEAPKGYWIQIVPRSSTFSKYNVIQTNSFGVVDTSYCGDNDILMLPVYALRDTVIKANERIAQFTLVKDVLFNIQEVEKLDNPDRGGFGHTGRK